VVVITGAAGGLGQAVSRRFAVAGAVLGLLDLDAERVQQMASKLTSEGVNCLGLSLDVRDEAACHRAIASLQERLGGLDTLINNAGITHRSAFARTQAAVYRQVMEVNYFGSLYCTQAALKAIIRSKGLIVVISSIAGFAPLLGRTGYAASKHALHGLFESLRPELRSSGVGVTMVCPGFTATGMEKSALGEDGHPTTHPRSMVGEAATPESVAKAIYHAASKDKRLLVLSSVGRLTRLMMKLSPALYESLMARSLRSELIR
jgi:NAD(P)-dependent dehydrogenase (short-subunit alcohol dehydrogenase family)